VIVEAAGGAGALDELERRIVEEAPPLAHIESFVSEEMQGAGESAGFWIVDSRSEGAPAVAVSVDVATCDACRAELRDPSDRRFGYPFINCTNCGPRYTIIRSIPYDRASTTMAPFIMCDRCRTEYEDPANRRFHAEPNACPMCGPHVRLVSSGGDTLAERAEALDQAAAMLDEGSILAVKGLGGYHLAADAGNEAAVKELRRRKARDDKPFAVMVPDVDAARALCRMTPEAEQALASPRRPIVLAPKAQADGAAAPGVAPGLPELGLMLPYTPLHDLLLDRVGRPLVMTSGNLSDEPIAHVDSDALERLGPLVDALLTHDRDIEIRCDDSVVRSLPRQVTGVQMVRRSRGYAPEPMHLLAPAPCQILAVGAELKNTVSVAKGDNVITSHHIGDLEHLAAYRSFVQAVGHLCHLTGVTPEAVAHDLHPEYLSTKYAADLDIPTLGVQHHHAHIASCLVDNGFGGRVLGIAYDGLGMGTDGTIWGGEFLVADLAGFTRVGRLRTVPLPGGNQAIREPWRMAVSWLDAVAGGEAAAEWGRRVDERAPAVLSMVERPETLRTSSAGRLFDAVAALLGLRARVTYEAQAAIDLEAAAAEVPLGETAPYDFDTQHRGDGLLVLDPGPLVERVVTERDKGTPVEIIAASFHDSLARATAEVATRVARRHSLDTVALSGGVFQNARLTAGVASELQAAGLRVLLHRHVPPNDGGISIGQAAIAASA
jgi:hydrogenase maturation protein HypF